MPFDWGTLGMQVAGQAAGGVMGMILGKENDKRQLAQQEKLQRLQIAGQKEMSDYMYGKQLQMWKDTNYAAQREQLEKAGLNPALLYGMSGGGGTTVGSGGGSVSGGNAPTGGGEVQALMGMGLQLNQIAAQTKLLEKQAENVEADTEMKKGVETEEITTRIEQIAQDTDNKRIQHDLMKLDQTLKNIENFEKQKTQSDRLSYIEYQTKQAIKEFNLLTNKEYISNATKFDVIKEIKANAVGAVLKNELTRAQTDKTKSDIAVNDHVIKKIVNDIMLNWDRLEQGNQELLLKQIMTQHGTDLSTDLFRGLSGSLGSIISMFKKGTTINNFNEYY